MSLEELVRSMELGGFLVWCPGTKRMITIQEYIEMAKESIVDWSENDN